MNGGEIKNNASVTGTSAGRMYLRAVKKKTTYKPAAAENAATLAEKIIPGRKVKGTIAR